MELVGRLELCCTGEKWRTIVGNRGDGVRVMLCCVFSLSVLVMWSGGVVVVIVAFVAVVVVVAVAVVYCRLELVCATSRTPVCVCVRPLVCFSVDIDSNGGRLVVCCCGARWRTHVGNQGGGVRVMLCCCFFFWCL